jgi:hypothetical protein
MHLETLPVNSNSRVTETEYSSCAQRWTFFTVQAQVRASVDNLHCGLYKPKFSYETPVYSGWLSSSSLSVPVVQDSSLPESPHDLREDGEDSLMSGRPWLAV